MGGVESSRPLAGIGALRASPPGDATPVALPQAHSGGVLDLASSAGVVEELWGRVRADLAARDSDGGHGLATWLERLEPTTLAHGTLSLATRNGHLLAPLRQRLVPLVEQALRRVVGTAIRVRIEVDTSLGGALRSLGLRDAPLPPTPATLQVVAENRLAAAAFQRLAREPRSEFDQLHLEGPEGVGKSLLLATLVWQRRRRFPRERWRIERADPFFRDWAATCREGRRAAFRGERIACDGFLFDDVHELAGKLICQEQLVEMVEYLRAHGRPVVFSGRPIEGGPRDYLPAFRSLLRQGLRLAIPQLAAPARLEILRARSHSDRGVIAGLVDELAAATDLPMGRAVAAIDAAVLRARTLGRPPTSEELAAATHGLVPAHHGAEPFDRLLERCAKFVGVERDLLVAGTRTRAAALGRHLAIYLAFEIFGLQRATVRRWLGVLSPSVQPYAKAKIEALRATDRRLDGFVREVAEEIGRGQRFLFG